MKKYIALFILLLSYSVTTKAFSQIAFYVNGIWGPWEFVNIGIYGGADGFKIFSNGEHPSNYFFEFEIFGPMTQKELKAAIKSQKNDWGAFDGIVRYYISDEYPDAESQYKAGKFVSPSLHNPNRGETPCKLVSRIATIKVHKFSKHAQLYNIYFDNVGIAILLDRYFDN